MKGIEDVELVIKIPRAYYELVLERCKDPVLLNAFKNGTPLPKGHGDLITKEQAIELVEFYQINPQHFNFVSLIDEIKDEKPIIEADRSEE